MRKIILASGSPRRKEILAKLGLKFTVVRNRYKEDMDLDLSPLGLAARLSEGKAESVAHLHRNSIIVAADTFIAFQGAVLGKPKSTEEARRILKRLSGKRHSVLTGVTVIDTKTGRKSTEVAETLVYFRKLTRREIDAYVRTKEPLDKAGAYGIQELGALLVEKIEGDFFNVMGLPILTLVRLLGRFGIRVL